MSNDQPNTVVTEVEQRFDPRDLLLLGLAGSMFVGLVLVWIAIASNIFDSTISYEGADGSPITESTFDLATAKFAVVVMIVLGAVLLVAGAIVAVAELATKTTVTTTVEIPSTDENKISEASAGIAALLAALAKLATSLGSAIKDLKASSALVLSGTLLVLGGGAVAWQTVPGTDPNPTIVESETETEADTATETGTASATEAASSATDPDSVTDTATATAPLDDTAPASETSTSTATTSD